MKLVEAEADGPVEGDDEQVTPPRPPHRRVSVSLLFTVSVLVGTVVTIYAVFPARHNVLIMEALERHHDTGVAWDLVSPGAPELRAWMIGAIDRDVAPLAPGLSVTGARTIDVLHRPAAVMEVHVGGGDAITLLVQHARGFVPDRAERSEDGMLAIEWRVGKSAWVAVGPEASAATWRRAVGAP